MFNKCNLLEEKKNKQTDRQTIVFTFSFQGIRILDKELTDTLKANGLGYKQHYVDIYSNSWGPKDNGYQIADVGVMTEAVLSKGAVEVKLIDSILQSEG